MDLIRLKKNQIAKAKKFSSILMTFAMSATMTPTLAFAEQMKTDASDTTTDIASDANTRADVPTSQSSNDNTENTYVEPEDTIDYDALDAEYESQTPRGYRYAGLDETQAVYEPVEYTMSLLGENIEVDDFKVNIEDNFVLPDMGETGEAVFVGWSNTIDGKDIKDDPDTKDTNEYVKSYIFEPSSNVHELYVTIVTDEKKNKTKDISLMDFDSDENGRIFLYGLWDEKETDEIDDANVEDLEDSSDISKSENANTPPSFSTRQMK